jgi:sec-independent protein translocase protein TatA
MGISNPVHLAFIAIVALIVLGPKRLPDLARSLGSGMREFRESLNAAVHDDEPELTRTVTQPVAAPEVFTSEGDAADTPAPGAVTPAPSPAPPHPPVEPPTASGAAPPEA